MEGGERRGEDGKDIVIFIIVFNFCLTFFFRSLNPPTAAFFFPLKTCWFIRVGGGCARGAENGQGDIVVRLAYHIFLVILDVAQVNDAPAEYIDTTTT